MTSEDRTRDSVVNVITAGLMIVAGLGIGILVGIVVIKLAMWIWRLG